MVRVGFCTSLPTCGGFK